MRIEVAEQVATFIRSCPPEPRRWLREALRKLENEKGDIKVLEGELAGYFRLRVRTYRIIFRYDVRRGKRLIRCDFVERRDIVYEAFQRTLGE